MPMLLTIPKQVECDRAEFCALLKKRFQNDLDILDFSAPSAAADCGTSVLDEWGCLWEYTPNRGWKASDVPRYEDILELDGIRFPKNHVTPEMMEQVNRFCENVPRFVLVQTRVQPFRRLCALGGAEAAAALIKRKPRELRSISMRMFEYYSRQIDAWCTTDADAIGLSDDLADEMGNRMPITRWNEIFVPMLKEFCQKIRNKDKFVYFTGTGNFEEFIPGLIFAGVDAIRFDAEAMDPLLLTERYGRRITFQPILKPDFIENQTEAGLASQIMAWRGAFAESEVIAECQMPAQVSMRKIASAMLNWRRRMPQPDNF